MSIPAAWIPQARPSPLMPRDNRVDSINRRSGTFVPKLVVVPTRGGSPPGPVLLSRANPRRISLWVRSARVNGSNVMFLGGQNVLGTVTTLTGGGAGYNGADSWDMEAGDVVIIDDSTADVWAVAQDGATTVMIAKVIENLDAG